MAADGRNGHVKALTLMPFRPTMVLLRFDGIPGGPGRVKERDRRPGGGDGLKALAFFARVVCGFWGITGLSLEHP